ncbi:AMP binding protein [Mucidula mucida]|nr:AMP binding protein [Mucidula mucida]
MSCSIYRSHLPDIPVPSYVGHHPGDYPVFIDSLSDTTITRAQLRSLALSLGYGIRHHPNIQAKRGDVALVFSPNSITFPVVIFGSVAAGLRTTLANVAYTPHELGHQYKDSGAQLIYTTEEGIPVVRAMLKELNIEDGDQRLIVLGKGFKWAGGLDAPRSPDATGLLYLEDLLGLGSLEEEEKFDGSDTHETVYLCYSSGTTGQPKGVETTHQNLTSNVEMVVPSLPDLTQRTASGVLPFFHIFGSVNLLLLPLRMGFATVVQPRFDPIQYCANIEKYKVAFSLIVPPILVMLARHPVVEKYDLSSLKMMISGAAPLAPPLAKKVMERLRSLNTFCPIVQGYGLTEASPVTHLVPFDLASDDNIGTSGLLMPSIEARLADEDGQDVAEGEAGELWGYLNNPTATANTVTPDGWLKTGDVAIRDHKGFFSIVDRRKELIKYKGFQVPPAELESILCGHPEIADAAVIAIYDEEQATELPRSVPYLFHLLDDITLMARFAINRAYVVPANPGKLNCSVQKATLEQEVGAWMKGQVAYHKYLRGGVIAIDVVPKSTAGKILRNQLRERAKLELAPAVKVAA